MLFLLQFLLANVNQPKACVAGKGCNYQNSSNNNNKTNEGKYGEFDGLRERAEGWGGGRLIHSLCVMYK
jgi:hypothetical protein